MTSQKTEMTKAFEQAGAIATFKNRQQDKKQSEPLKKYLSENYHAIAKF